MTVLRNLLVPIDSSEASAPAVDLALRLASDFDAAITFCHSVDLAAAVADSSSPYGVADVGVILESLESDSKSALGDAASKAAAAGVAATTVELTGPAVNTIIEAAKARSADAIVIGTHGRHGLSRFFLGSVADGTLRRASIPVFIGSHDSGSGPFERIGVALDDSDPADAALDFALRLVRPGQTTVVLTNVVDVRRIYGLAVAQRYSAAAAFSEEQKVAGDLLEKAAATVKDRGVAVETVLLEADPIAGLVDFTRAQRIDLLAIGTHGRRGLRRLLLGSVAEGVIRESPVPVVALRTGAAADRL